jgi:hypothetical protein
MVWNNGSFTSSFIYLRHFVLHSDIPYLEISLFRLYYVITISGNVILHLYLDLKLIRTHPMDIPNQSGDERWWIVTANAIFVPEKLAQNVVLSLYYYAS